MEQKLEFGNESIYIETETQTETGDKGHEMGLENKARLIYCEELTVGESGDTITPHLKLLIPTTL